MSLMIGGLPGGLHGARIVEHPTRPNTDYDSEDSDESGPIELPNGRLVVVSTTLSFMEEEDDEVEDDDDEMENEDEEFVPKTAQEAEDIMDAQDIIGPKKRRGTGRVWPRRFNPPKAKNEPLALFEGVSTYWHFARYVHRKDRIKGLIFTDAGPPELNTTHSCGNVKGCPEKKGPSGDSGAQTSNRAELRAVIGALGLRHWPGEGFKTLVFATDSEYVVEGATKWAKRWLKNDWKTAKGEAVKNKDLWEMLLGEVERFAEDGMTVEFWRIGRELNTVADSMAKEGAAMGDAPETYCKVFGI